MIKRLILSLILLISLSNLQAQTFSGATGAITDAPNPGGDDYTVTVTGVGNLFAAGNPEAASKFFNLKFNITHPNTNDLTITLTSPEGTTVIIADQVGDDTPPPFNDTEDFTNTILSQNTANQSISDGTNPFTGEYLPMGIAANDLSGDDPIRFEAFDNENADGVWTLTITDGTPTNEGTLVDWSLVFIPNFQPKLTDDAKSLFENDSTEINVIANDTDPENGLDTNSLSIVTPTDSGSLSILDSGVVKYVPNTGFSGNDTFLYKLCDNHDSTRCDTAMVVITVIPNEAPTALNDFETTFQNIPVTINVLANDTDFNGKLDSNSIALIQTASNGLAEITEGNQITYSPDTGFSGNDTFTYAVCDFGTPALCDTAMVIITVDPDEAPIATNDFDTTVEITLVEVDVLANDADPEGKLDTSSLAIAVDAINGITEVLANGIISYLPDTGFFGTDSFSYSICDSATPKSCDTAWVFVFVKQDLDPIANNDFDTTVEITLVEVNVLLNDSDPEGKLDTSSLAIAENAINGLTEVLANGNISYLPDTGFFGADSFSYSICDSATPKNCDTAWVFVFVKQDLDPIANNDFDTTVEITPIEINVLLNDSDPEGKLDTSSLAIAENAINGITEVLANGNISYLPDTGFFGADSFSYSICDSATPKNCDTAWVFVQVNPDLDPIALDDTATTVEEIEVDIFVLNNDTDTDGTIDSSGVEVVLSPANGTITAISDKGVISYLPNAAFVGNDTFTYAVCDIATPKNCDTAQVIVTVTENLAPVALEDSAKTVEATEVDIAVLANDTDFDGTLDSANVLIIEDAKNGTITNISEEGVITYLPNVSFVGADTFTYSVCDQAPTPKCDTAMVIVTVIGNIAPIALNDSIDAADGELVVAFVLENDTDEVPGLDSSSIEIITEPSNGVATASADGNIEYQSAFGFVGNDTLTYSVCDGGNPALCDTAQLVIKVTAYNNLAPILLGDSAAGSSSAQDPAIVLFVAANDTDERNRLDTASLEIITTTTNGTSTISANGEITYTPTLGFDGKDTLTYKICDLEINSLCDTAMVIFTITDNFTPIAKDDSVGTPQDESLVILVLANDTDPENDLDTLSLVITENTVNGVASISNALTGEITYTPNPDYFGMDTFYYKVCDKGTPSKCDSAMVVITVEEELENVPPVALNDSFEVQESIEYCLNVVANDSDKVGGLDTASIEIITAASNGVLNFGDAGEICYKANDFYTGLDSFVYSICDSHDSTLCDTATVYINVISRDNLAPSAINDSTTTVEEDIVEVEVLVNDSDPESDPLSVTEVLAASNGSTSVVGTDKVSYKANNGFLGMDSFQYVICDDRNGCDTAMVYVEVKVYVKPNEAPMATNDSITVFKNSPKSFNVLTNDSDPEDKLDLNSLRVTQNPASGSVTTLNNGTVIFNPKADFTGVVTFKYEICDLGDPILCDEATVTVTVIEVPTSINTNTLAVNVYPNPTKGELFIEFSNSVNEVVNVEIFNSNGSLLKTVQTTNNIDLTELPSGIYLIKLSSADKFKTLRVQKL